MANTNKKAVKRSKRTVENNTKERRLNLSAECLERALETSCGLFQDQPLKKKDTAHRFLHPVTAYKVQTLQRHGTYLQHKTMSQPTMIKRNIPHLPQPRLMYGKLTFHSKRGGMLELTQEKEKRYACQRRAQCAKHTKVDFHFPVFTACKQRHQHRGYDARENLCNRHCAQNLRFQFS